MRKKFCHYVTVGILGVLLIGGTVSAAGTGRASQIKSSGIFHYQNGEDASQSVYFDAGDLVTLANEIDDLETDYKSGILERLNGIGTYFDGSGNFTHIPQTTENPNTLELIQLLDGISNSQAVDTGTTANNISENKGAWIKGEYIVGNGSDVNEAYLQGFADGSGLVQDDHIEYIFHKHTGNSGKDPIPDEDVHYSNTDPGGCYVDAGHTHNATDTCPKTESRNISFVGSGTHNDGTNKVYCDYKCNNCEHQWRITWASWADAPANKEYVKECPRCYNMVYSCDNSINTWELGCNKSTNTVIGATIIWED